MKARMVLAVVAVVFTACASVPVDTPSWFPAPKKPSGPSECAVGQVVKYTTEGTDPLDVHEFSWDFGDGSPQTDWKDDGEAMKHVFGKAGHFQVKVKERCPLKLFETDWSEGKGVTVK